MVQFSNRTKFSPVRKRWYKTQTVPKPVNSQKKMVQYSNRAKTCHQSEKDGTILKQSQNLTTVKKRWCNSQTLPKPANSQKKMVQYSNRAITCHQSEKDVKYSDRAKTCQESKKDGTILKQCQNLITARKRWCNSQTEQIVTSQKKWYNTQTVPKPANSQYR